METGRLDDCLQAGRLPSCDQDEYPQLHQIDLVSNGIDGPRGDGYQGPARMQDGIDLGVANGPRRAAAVSCHTLSMFPLFADCKHCM
jgi:hypothetical protein